MFFLAEPIDIQRRKMSNSVFIYAISVLYGLQGLAYAQQGNYPMAGLVALYGLAGIPLIIMGK